MSRSSLSLAAWGACALVALTLGGCMGGSGRDTVSLARAAGEGQRTVAVPTRMTTGGRTANPASFLVLGVN